MSWKPSVEELHELLSPRRTPSRSQSLSIGRARSVDQEVSVTPLGGLLPSRKPSLTSSISRHSLVVGRRMSSGFVGHDTVTSVIAPTVRQRSSSCSATIHASMQPTKIQRWSGLTRTAKDWDHGLRRDPELWYEDGDCYVHLHAKGASRRGPSFRIPFAVLRQKKCSAMLSQCDAQLASTSTTASEPLRRMPSSLTNSSRQASSVELFIPTPNEVTRQNAFRWHITTRNFFAFLLGKPLVGEHMGQAFVDLQERLCLFRPSDVNNREDFLDYIENQGYRDLVECTDYALASLFYAEHYKLRDVWVDAFAHCVGMNDSLILSPEFAAISRLTKALITRAHVEVGAHLGRVSTALSNFLEEDLSPSYLGLTDATRSHLDRFRRFLHTFYVDKFGYWPPPQGLSFPKALYKSMYYDFKNLYDYLVDTESTIDISSQKPASGGICVLQNVVTFDQRLHFNSQPHPLPLLPTYLPPPKRTDSYKALRQLTLATQHNKTHTHHAMSDALLAATNTPSRHMAESKIVQAYMHFEEVHAATSGQRGEKITAMDARKVRWLLIYGTLQYLLSALQSPKEVRDAETPEYPLCYVAEPAISTTNSRDVTPLATPSIQIPEKIDETLSESHATSYSIQPDCQREDYFTPTNRSRRGSLEIAPLKVSQSQRESCVRFSAIRSLSTRSSRRNSLTTTQYSPTTLYGYGEELHLSVPYSPPFAKPRPASSVYSQQSPTSIIFDEHKVETSWFRSRTPSASRSRHASIASIDAGPTNQGRFIGTGEPPCRSDSTSSTGSSVWSEGASAVSSKSSTCGEHFTPKASDAEESGLLGGLVSVAIPISPAESHIHPLLRQQSLKHEFQFGFDTEPTRTHSVHEPTDVTSTIGMAVSTPCAPVSSVQLALERQCTFAPFGTPSLISQEELYLSSQCLSIQSALERTSSKKDRGRSSTFSSPPSGYWEQYRATLTQQKARSSAGSPSPLNASSALPSMSRLPTVFKFLALAALFGAAIAAPLSLDPNFEETITITAYTLVLQNGGIHNVVFNLTGNDATNLDCRSNDSIEDLSKIYQCGKFANVTNSPYSFGLYATNEDESGYGLRLYHAFGVGIGFYGEGVLNTTCTRFEPVPISPTYCSQTLQNPVARIPIDSK
ncbi:hypothetical protein A1F97_07851, partial [Pyrenophora tritici-repentis]